MPVTAIPSQGAPQDWACARIPRGRRDLVLDIGAHPTRRSLAGEVALLITLGGDSGAETTTGEVANVVHLDGDPSALAFPDASLRVVLWGWQLHRCADPHRQLTEIKRVLEPSGWLGLADLVVSEDPELARAQNRIESLRDPAHVRALSASQLQDTLVRLGYEVAGAQTREVRRPVEAWLEPTVTSDVAADEICALLRADAGGGPPTGLAPRIEADGGVSVTHTLTSLLVLNRDA